MNHSQIQAEAKRAGNARKWYAVIGRIPYDDEDTCLIYWAESEESARQSFADQMYEDRGIPDRERKSTIKEIGGDLGVYITHTLVSDHEIREA